MPVYPMTVSLFPLLKVHKSQPKWKYYLSMSLFSSFIMVNCKRFIKKLTKHRIDFWMGIGIGNLVHCNFNHYFRLFNFRLFNKDMLIGLAIVNPVYFFCMMIGAMKNISISIAVILGTILGPLVFIYTH